MLYVFGDSFTHDIKDIELSNDMRRKVGLFPPFQPLEHNWINLVSKKLTGSIEHVNDSMAGCANEYIFHKLMNRMAEFKEGDYVIVSLTASNRRWLVERCPHLANWSNCKFEPDIEGSVTKEENKAILQYARYLHSDIASNSIYNAFVWSTIYAARSVEHLGVKFLILPGFDSIAGVTGNLVNVSSAEFDNVETLNQYYLKTTDSRWNHFSEINHIILAEKVCDYFTDFKMIDLTTGFKTNIYTKDNI